jgi:predicted nicotinamide N-methyase
MDFNEFGRLWRGFQASRVVITAVELKVFDRLKRPKTAAEAARVMKTDLRAMEILLDALTGIRLLNKKGARYSLTRAARHFLLTDAPHYQGDIIMHGSTMWDNWSALTEVVLTGKPARRAFNFHAFIMGMDNVSRKRAPELVRTLGTKGVGKVLDLGGGPGTNSIAFAKKGLDVTLFDYPETLKIARKVARSAGVKLRMKGGDFTVDPIGRGYDLILVSQIFHAYDEDSCRAITGKCFDALAPGGRIAVQEIPVTEDRTDPPSGALFAINMLVATEGGRTYPAPEICEWLEDAGFIKPKVKELKETVLIEAARPRG